MIITTCSVRCNVCKTTVGNVEVVDGVAQKLPAGWVNMRWTPGILSSNTEKPIAHLCSDACKKKYREQAENEAEKVYRR